MRKVVSIALSLLLVAVLSGCVSASKARVEVRKAYLAGQREAMARLEKESKHPSVTFIAQVSHHVIQWTPGMTLSQAIVKAVYTSPENPKLIVIHRNGQDIQIKPDDLLAGKDVPVAPGDVIEIQ